ncbi:NAD(P)-dependent oxidoreductase [Nibrella saemangeumensis]|uniref:NAD(P)-dependent oxidoreductase n=1 Tax=Nibrella saemangeumensis TaxID=1084526 RepID=A0ABP8NQS5_9BACT
MNDSIGLIGLGSLGLPLAENILAAGHPLTVYNRTPHKAKPLGDKGATVAASASEVAQTCRYVITLLSDDAALKEVTLTDEFARNLGADGIHISMSTIAPQTARQLAEHHARFDARYVAAPIFGRPAAVAAKQAWVCVSGDAEAKEQVKPILSAIVAQGLYDFGDEPSTANVVKLAGNFMIGAAMEAMAEAMTVAEKNGVSRQALIDMFSSTMFASPIYKNYGTMIARQVYDENVGFRLPLGLKDMNLVLQMASEVKAPMPLAQLVQSRLVSALAKGRENWDWTGLAYGASEDAGTHS